MKDNEDDEIRPSPFTLWRSKVVKIVLASYGVIVFASLPMSTQLRALVVVALMVTGLVYLTRRLPDDIAGRTLPPDAHGETYDFAHNRLVIPRRYEQGDHDRLPEDISAQYNDTFYQLIQREYKRL